MYCRDVMHIMQFYHPPPTRACSCLGLYTFHGLCCIWKAVMLPKSTYFSLWGWAATVPFNACSCSLFGVKIGGDNTTVHLPTTCQTPTEKRSTKVHGSRATTHENEPFVTMAPTCPARKSQMVQPEREYWIFCRNMKTRHEVYPLPSHQPQSLHHPIFGTAFTCFLQSVCDPVGRGPKYLFKHTPFPDWEYLLRKFQTHDKSRTRESGGREGKMYITLACQGTNTGTNICERNLCP